MAAEDISPTSGRLGRARPPLGLPGRRGRLAGTLVIGTGLAVYSWMAASTAPFTRSALVSVLLPGAVLAAIAIWRPPARICPPDELDVAGFSYWAISLAALFEWEASAFRDDSHTWHPSLTDLINPLITPHPLKSAAFLLWLLAGWALVRR
ncbi:MAG: hypothetical protein ABSA03_01915 [Streptosporangiaceae bacterium]|jgi:hypothetical protein